MLGIKILESIQKSKRFNIGYCPICEKLALFLEQDSWLRDNYICYQCLSIPRFRAIIRVIKTLYPHYKELSIHECSPGGASANKLKAECHNYTYSFYFPDTPYGSYKDNHRCENLEQMTFEDNSFDIFISQDVMEHILNPDKAFKEIYRVLKPGGAHIFTVPLYKNRASKVRAIVSDNEGIKHLENPIYHGDPINEDGSLVVTEWGEDIKDYIYNHSGMKTEIHLLKNRWLGLDGEFLEVFISKKII